MVLTFHFHIFQTQRLIKNYFLISRPMTLTCHVNNNCKLHGPATAIHTWYGVPVRQVLVRQWARGRLEKLLVVCSHVLKVLGHHYGYDLALSTGVHVG